MAICAHADFILRSMWVVEGLQEETMKKGMFGCIAVLRPRSVSRRKTRQHMKKAC